MHSNIAYFRTALQLKIRIKLCIFLSVIIAGIVGYYFVHPIVEQKKQAVAEVYNESQSIIEMLAFNIAPLLVEADRANIKRALIHTASNNTIVNIVVNDHNGHEVAAYARLPAGDKNKNDPQAEDSKNDSLLRIVTPIVHENTNIGSIKTLISLSDVGINVAVKRLASAVIGIMFILFGGASAYAVGLMLTYPINNLTEIVRHATNGDYSLRACVYSNDEIGVLSEAINELFENIDGKCIKRENVSMIMRDSLQEMQIERDNTDLSTSIASSDEERIRDRNEFIANLSHELRTPLTSIIGATSLLSNTTKPQEQGEFLLILEDSSRALMETVNNLLELAEIKNGKKELNECEFNLRDSIQQDVNLFTLDATEKGLSLIYYIEPMLPDCIIGDQEHLSRIMKCLVSNAIKFTSKGSIEIHVSTDRTNNSKTEASDDSIRLHISIRDTGIGIPPGKVPNIFDSFTQADGSMTRNYGGMGLGLSIAKQLVEMLDGKIWLETYEGNGSTFHFTAQYGRKAKSWQQITSC